MSDTIIILPGGERFRLEWRQSDPERWERRLKAKYDESRKAARADKARCLCRHRGAVLPLQIRYRADSDSYHLAVWPHEGPLHEKTCPFFKPDPGKSGRAGYVSSVIREEEDGDVSVTLSIGLRRKGPPQPVDETPLPAPDRPGRTRQRRMSPLGLLNLLWERAGLAEWKPQFAGHRTMPAALGRVASAGTRIRTQKRPLSDLLCPVAPDHEGFARRLHAIVRAEGKENHLFLAGFVDAIEQGRGNDFTLTLTGQRNGYRCFLTLPAAERNRLARSHRLAAATLALPEAERQARVAALLYVTAQHITKPDSRWKGWIQAEVRTAALMTVSPEMIPVESSYELAVAEALVAADRTFEKPLRFDAGEDLVFPDFILQDTVRSAGYPMEVFGRTDEAYMARRAEKEDYYNTTFGAGGWWSWDAITRTGIPAFPPARNRGTP
ncbi:DUF1173 family protein [Acetobacter musti]|uniref:DUF1173 family protein n=1 Tax=Acetobacter musti TaxID=864732 RepID=A0ABX0JUE2_9PROT|nr:DUF1173 family protein [Acetobacter musti]NHN86449.1 DUF1173 family protein [Acetobacter musti]